MQLSVIIPVYNVAEYISKCVQSLVNQDILFSDYEIIIVNDGSTDNSKQVIVELKSQFDNIVFIDQQNQGVSIARNNAIAIAKGKYILPIDPDDYVMPDTLGRILRRADTELLDILQLSFHFLNEQEKVIWKTDYSNIAKKNWTGINAYAAHRGKMVKDPDRSWAILYRRSLLEEFQIKYTSGVPYLEDGLFLAKVFTVAQRCGFDNEIFYIRTTRIGSATNSNLFFTDKAVNGFLLAVEDILRFKQQNDLSNEQFLFLDQPITKFILLTCSSSYRNAESINLRTALLALKKLGCSKCPIYGCNEFYKREGFIFNVSPRLYLGYKDIYNKIQILIRRYFHKPIHSN